MANIKLTVKCPVYDGIPITFRAPCGSADVDKTYIFGCLDNNDRDVV